MKNDNCTKLTILCDDGWECQGCPEIYLDQGTSPDQEVRITDDFGQHVTMSREQFRTFVREAEAGGLDTI